MKPTTIKWLNRIGIWGVPICLVIMILGFWLQGNGWWFAFLPGGCALSNVSNMIASGKSLDQFVADLYEDG